MDIQLEKTLLESIYRSEGMSGLLHQVNFRTKEGQTIGALLAFAYAAELAHLVFEKDGKAILIEKRNLRYVIHAWVPEHGAFANCDLEGDGFGYYGSLTFAAAASALYQAVKYLSLVRGPITPPEKVKDFEAFQKALRQSDTVQMLKLASK